MVFAGINGGVLRLYWRGLSGGYRIGLVLILARGLVNNLLMLLVSLFLLWLFLLWFLFFLFGGFLLLYLILLGIVLFGVLRLGSGILLAVVGFCVSLLIVGLCGVVLFLAVRLLLCRGIIRHIAFGCGIAAGGQGQQQQSGQQGSQQSFCLMFSHVPYLFKIALCAGASLDAPARVTWLCWQQLILRCAFSSGSARSAPRRRAARRPATASSGCCRRCRSSSPWSRRVCCCRRVWWCWASDPVRE